MSADRVPRLNAALEGRYRIERPLGEGGMANVYLADDLRHERQVALKVLKPELAAVVGAARFLAEIKTTAKLQHPHILPLFDSGEADGFLFYVMPYVEGESLRERLDRQHQLPVDEAVQIGQDVAEALDYAHSQGVIHRDIKPANILLHAGRPLIADFGIALAIGAAGGGRLTETGLSLGTPHYMSPEQATGDPSVGAATDIYALGCVLYEMLVGEPPYTGSTPQAVLGRIVTGDLDPVTRHRGSVPAHVDAVVRRALERVPADRFTTARAFAQALADPGFRHGDGPAVVASPSRGVRAWAVCATAVAVLSTSVAAALVRRPGPPPLVSRHVLSTQGWEGGQNRIGRYAAIAPDGSSMILPVDGQLGLKMRSSTEITPIPGTENGRDVVYSPDGESIAYSVGAELFKRPIVGGSPVRIAEDLATDQGVLGLDWLDDGTILYERFSPAEGRRLVARIAEEGGETLEVVFGRDQQFGIVWVRGLPASRGALVVACEGTACSGTATRLYVVDLESHTSTLAFDQVLRAWYAPTGHIVYVRADGTVLAQPFDLAGLTTTGPAVPLFSGVRVIEGSTSDYADMHLARNGMLLYTRGAVSYASATSLVFVDRDGRTEPVQLEPQDYLVPRFSPEGNRILAAVRNADIDLWVFDLDREGARSRITFGGQNQFYPTWAPDGNGVASSTGITAPNSIFVASADGSGRTETLIEREGVQYPTSWARDGTLIFYENDPETQRDLWVRPEGGDPRPFLVTPFNEAGGALSHDGRWLAYTSDKSGRAEVYVQAYPGPGREFTVSTRGGSEPLWSPDDSELFYRSADQVMIVSVDARDTFRASAPRSLFPDVFARSPGGAWGAPNYDVSPDGQRFVMVSANGPSVGGEGVVEEPQVVLVENFFEELKELADTN